jgi:hypothetical protein
LRHERVGHADTFLAARYHPSCPTMSTTARQYTPCASRPRRSAECCFSAFSSGSTLGRDVGANDVDTDRVCRGRLRQYHPRHKPPAVASWPVGRRSEHVVRAAVASARGQVAEIA